MSAAVSGLPFFVWEVPGKPISIQLHFDVIDRMSPEILRGLGALKRRGAEVGGLLLGRSEPGFRHKVTIEDFEPVPSEYLTGPSYNLSPKDLIAFEDAIARRQDDTGGLTVVGFYRSHTRDELFMDDADMGLAANYFPGVGNVFLLIKPFATRSSVAGFFFWEDGEINRETSYLQFPFHRRELGGGEARVAPAASRSPQERPLPPYTPAPEPEQPPAAPPPADEAWTAIRNANLSILSEAKEPPARQFPWKWLTVLAFFALASLAGYFGYQNLSGSRPAAVPTPLAPALPLKLSVAEKQDQIDVTWDRNAPAIALAQRGVLSISDGANRRDLELSGAQLRNGRVLYSQLSADVGLRLEVFPEGKESVSESIRIVSPESARLPSPEPPRVQPPIPAARPTPVTPPPDKPAPEKSAAVEAPRVEAPRMETPRKAPVLPDPRPPVRTAPRAPAPVRTTPETRAVEAPKPPAVTPAPEAPPEVELQRPARRR